MTPPSLAPEVAASEDRWRQLELTVTRRLDGLLHGDHLGMLPGPGSEAGEARAYQPGDDARRIDWNLTARSLEPHVRDTVADRELETWVVVDGSASLDFGTARSEKRDLALAATAAFGFLTCAQGNRFGVVVAEPSGTTVMPARAGRDAVRSVITRLDRRARAESGAVSLADALGRVRFLARRRGLLVVVSDLLDGGDWARPLRALCTRHDVVVVDVRDPREDVLVPVGLLTLVDPETGRRREVQTADPRLRARFAQTAADRRAATTRTVRGAGAHHLVLSTERDWTLDVVRFVATRRRLQ
jgi:uncharacterized protein (DUF58 family)